MRKTKIGVFSGYDPRPWVMEDCAEGDIKTLERFVSRLEKDGRWEVVWPGRRREGWDKLVHTTRLAHEYAAELIDADVAGLVNVHPTWTFPQLSQMVVSSYRQRLAAADPTARPRVVMASIQDTTVPGMVSGMATGGAYQQTGEAFGHVFGDFEEPEFWDELGTELDLFGEREMVSERARQVVEGLHDLHAIEFGSFSLQMPTTRIDQEELTKRWGITSESLDQQVFLDRAFDMFTWSGERGRSAIVDVLEPEVEEALSKNYDAHPEKFAAIEGRETSRDKYALQVAMYLASFAIAEERGASAVTIKCQDECSGRFATCCMATSFLGNDVDMNRKTKRIIPTSCETDLPTMYSQALLHRLSGKPVGFGDFRYVKTSKKRGKPDETLLAIVNCGQHPVYYAGLEETSTEEKFAQTDHPGQEHFYAAGGAAVRMRTAKGQAMTVARLGVENGRLYLVACPLTTTGVPPARHKTYNEAWPIIEGHVPVTDKVLGKKWPSNHLAFVYGDYVPHLIELAERMGIGYLIWDRQGRELSRPS